MDPLKKSLLQVCVSGDVTENAVVLGVFADVLVAVCEGRYDGMRLKNKGGPPPGKPKQSSTQRASASSQVAKISESRKPKAEKTSSISHLDRCNVATANEETLTRSINFVIARQKAKPQHPLQAS